YCILSSMMASRIRRFSLCDSAVMCAAPAFGRGAQARIACYTGTWRGLCAIKDDKPMPAIDLLPFTDPWLYALMAVLILGSAFVQGVGGVGFTMFAAPVAAIVCPELVPGPLLTLGGFVTLLTAIRESRH